MAWLGDFNRHHNLWEIKANDYLYESEALIKPLLDLLLKHDMRLVLPKGIPTYQTVAGNWTRPDNVWMTKSAVNPLMRCNTVNSICPPRADHMPIVTVLDLPLPRLKAPTS